MTGSAKPLVYALCWWLLLAACAVHAQVQPAERTYHASRADVQKALHQIPSYSSGKLPVLEGFADGSGHSLESYQRGYYQYDLQLQSPSPTETVVHVTAKITAWYAGSSAANSGYRVLKSSGRLESDLLDSLDDKLNPAAAKPADAAPAPPAPKLPDSPSASGSFFNSPRLTTTPSDMKPPAPKAPAAPPTKREQALTQQIDTLEQALHNQTRPSNLAVVKRSNTPVRTQPLDGSEVLFQAEAEDEFEVLDAVEGWVHVQISGISRGWIHRDYVDMPGAATVSVAAMGGDPHDKEPVRQTREQVGTFPGKWEPLDGKQVKIIWVQPLDKDQFGSEPKWNVAKSIFRKADAGNPSGSEVAGVVVIFDSEDGGMAATTVDTLQQWRAGHLGDEVFWKRSWRDPEEAFQGQK